MQSFSLCPWYLHIRTRWFILHKKTDVFSWTNRQGAVHFEMLFLLAFLQAFHIIVGLIYYLCSEVKHLTVTLSSRWTSKFMGDIAHAFSYTSAGAHAPDLHVSVQLTSSRSLCNQFHEKTMHWKIKLQVASILIRFVWCHFNWKYIPHKSDEIIWTWLVFQRFLGGSGCTRPRRNTALSTQKHTHTRLWQQL